jgi:hypothetical protein
MHITNAPGVDYSLSFLRSVICRISPMYMTLVNFFVQKVVFSFKGFFGLFYLCRITRSEIDGKSVRTSLSLSRQSALCPEHWWGCSADSPWAHSGHCDFCNHYQQLNRWKLLSEWKNKTHFQKWVSHLEVQVEYPLLRMFRPEASDFRCFRILAICLCIVRCLGDGTQI